MSETFAGHLNSLKGSSVQISDCEHYVNVDEEATVSIAFANGTKLRADYWRLIKKEKHVLSNFDHQHQYGLPAPIDAKTELRNELGDKIVADAKLDTNTGDLFFCFEGRLVLQVLNFTGYEVWEITFPDGVTEYSNYNR